MNNKLSRWLAGAGAAVLLVPILMACSGVLPASPAASVPTSAVVPTSVPAATAPAPTAVVPVATAVPGTPAPVDLSKVMPKPFDEQMQAELEAYITTVMQRERVPGAAVAVVQNGEVVYQQGFGVRELGKPDRVTPETLMMIGSTAKSITTMMMASVVDDGKMQWDTPAVDILPSFAVSDPSLIPKNHDAPPGLQLHRCRAARHRDFLPKRSGHR